MRPAGVLKQIQKQYELRMAVKEALDTLPSAVCYFTSAGAVRLSNIVMYDLYRELAGRDLQSYAELKEALISCGPETDVTRDGNVFLFPDGRAWQYTEEKVTTADGKVYMEAVFDDVSELYARRQELRDQSLELKKMYEELRVLSGNILEMTREQEILNLKVRLHDQMNMGVAAIRQILRQSGSPEENAAAIRQFRNAIQVLQEESTVPGDDVSEFIRDAAVSGVRVVIDGELPREGKMLQLLVAVMREACVNAARHADATALFVKAGRTETSVILHFTNDGRRPEGEVTPLGGLKELRKSIEEAGGKMEIRTRPEFQLTVSLPVKPEEL